MRNNRKLTQIINGNQTSDGDGVQLKRFIGSPELDMLDPFLLLDSFGSDQPLDYIGGFPPHPHRGFETVTYMLAGKMRHKDSAGNEGVIEAGGVQWMTAGKGIIHSEMPEQEEGLLSGLQLWVNLPASKKMTVPRYQEYDKQQIPVEKMEDGIEINVIAGKTKNGTIGIINNELINPTYWHIHMNEGVRLTEEISEVHNAFIYVIDGKISVGDEGKRLTKGQLGITSEGHSINIKSLKKSEFVLVAGQPLNEPVARGGPFVMNSKKEILQAFADYSSGQLT